jgi:putative MATE family efflux protein
MTVRWKESSTKRIAMHPLLIILLALCILPSRSLAPPSIGQNYLQTYRSTRIQLSHSEHIHCKRTKLSFSNEESTPSLDPDGSLSSWSRLISALPKLAYNKTDRKPSFDELDTKILTTAIPSMLNLMVVPLVNAVDTFYVGRLADPLALAAQSAANQCFFTIYFLAAFLPTITAPLVADAIGRKDWDEAKRRVCESLFLSNVLGGIFCGFMVMAPQYVLRLVLPPSLTEAGGGVMQYAVPYLKWRALGMIPALFSATGFAAYRGLLNTVTPLKVSLVTNLLNLLLDPIFIFGNLGGKFVSIGRGLGAAGAAAATSLSELTSSIIYLRLLMRRRLISWLRLFQPPSLTSLLPLIKGGAAMLLRQATLNMAFVSAARRAQVMDPSGISAAAYGITMQIYSLGVVAHLGVQGTAAALVSSSRALGGDESARAVADRIFVWGSILGSILALIQWIALPMITPLFSPLDEVRQAVKGPAAISSFIHLVNGLVFAGEGTMLGLASFRDLALITGLGVTVMLGSLASPLGKTLNGVLLSLAAFNLVQGLAVTLHHIRFSPLRRRGFKSFQLGKSSKGFASIRNNLNDRTMSIISLTL